GRSTMRPRILIGVLASTLIAAPFAGAASFVPLSPKAPSSDTTPGPAPGITPVIVQSRLGGRIFGFDIDPDRRQGILSEALWPDEGRILAGVETFDQLTGEIIGVVASTSTQDDFLTLGVVGRHVGLVEREHEIAFLDVERTFPKLDPLASNHFTARWDPP